MKYKGLDVEGIVSVRIMNSKCTKILIPLNTCLAGKVTPNPSYHLTLLLFNACVFFFFIFHYSFFIIHFSFYILNFAFYIFSFLPLPNTCIKIQYNKSCAK